MADYFLAELAQAAAELAIIGVEHKVDVEAEPAQSRGHGLSVTDRALQLGGIGVGADSDNEGDAPLLLRQERPRRDEPGQQQQEERTTENAHAFLLLRAHLKDPTGRLRKSPRLR